MATDTAQVVLMDQSLRQLGLLFDIARQFQTNMKKTFAIVFILHAGANRKNKQIVLSLQSGKYGYLYTLNGKSNTSPKTALTPLPPL